MAILVGLGSVHWAAYGQFVLVYNVSKVLRERNWMTVTLSVFNSLHYHGAFCSQVFLSLRSVNTS